jgi:PAS domain-containing protein
VHDRKDGCVIPVETYAKCLECGGRQYVIAFVQDISERKQAAETLKENERLLSNILESMDEGLYVLDNDFQCTIFNRSLERMVEKKKEEVVGKAPWESFPKNP